MRSLTYLCQQRKEKYALQIHLIDMKLKEKYLSQSSNKYYKTQKNEGKTW